MSQAETLLVNTDIPIGHFHSPISFRLKYLNILKIWLGDNYIYHYRQQSSAVFIQAPADNVFIDFLSGLF